MYAQDATDIIRHSVERDATNFERFKNYTFFERVEDRRYGRNGTLAPRRSRLTNSWSWAAVLMENWWSAMTKLCPTRKPSRNRKKWTRSRPSANASLRPRKSDKTRTAPKSDAYLREVPEAFDLTVQETEQIDGRPVWIIGAQPKSGYRPKLKRAEILAHLRGKIWVDQADYQWVKAEVEVIDPISFELGLVKLASGSVLNFDQVRVNEEVWLPAHISVRAGARLFYLRKFREELDVTYRDYHKFQADSRVVE